MQCDILWQICAIYQTFVPYPYSHDEIQQVFAQKNMNMSMFNEEENSNFNLFLGGRIKEFHAGKSGFRGCLYQLIIDNQEKDFENDPVNTANVVPCQE